MDSFLTGTYAMSHVLRGDLRVPCYKPPNSTQFELQPCISPRPHVKVLQTVCIVLYSWRRGCYIFPHNRDCQVPVVHCSLWSQPLPWIIVTLLSMSSQKAKSGSSLFKLLDSDPLALYHNAANTWRTVEITKRTLKKRSGLDHVPSTSARRKMLHVQTTVLSSTRKYAAIIEYVSKGRPTPVRANTNHVC